MAAPRTINELAAFIDAKFVQLDQLLQQLHKPIYPIWAEAALGLSALGYDWSFGSGLNSSPGQGVVIPFRSSLIALSMSVTAPGAFDSNAFDTDAFDVEAFAFAGTVQAKVEVERDGVVESDYAIEIVAGTGGRVEFHTALQFSAGSVLNFRTLSETDTLPGNRIAAWMRQE